MARVAIALELMAFGLLASACPGPSPEKQQPRAAESAAPRSSAPPIARTAPQAPASQSASPRAPIPKPDSAEARRVHELSGTIERYVEVLTADAGADEALPLVVAVHGLGDTPESFSYLARDLSVKARIAVPQGIRPFGGGYAWLDPTRDVSQSAAEYRHVAQALVTFLDTLRARHKTLGRPILTGFSQGGMLAFAVAAAFPHAISEAIPIGGSLPESLWPKQIAANAFPRVTALHGSDDQRVPAGPSRRFVGYLRSRGVQARFMDFPDVAHAIPKPMHEKLLELLKDACERERQTTATPPP